MLQVGYLVSPGASFLPHFMLWPFVSLQTDSKLPGVSYLDRTPGPSHRGPTLLTAFDPNDPFPPSSHRVGYGFSVGIGGDTGRWERHGRKSCQLEAADKGEVLLLFSPARPGLPRFTAKDAVGCGVC